MLNAPIIANDALRTFLNIPSILFGKFVPDKFTGIEISRSLDDPFDTNEQTDLMDLLPYARGGYVRGTTAEMLMSIYAYNNNLFDPADHRYIIPDQNLINIFGGNIPATWYVYRDQNNKIQKMLMEDAVNQRYIQNPINTFDVLKNGWPSFNPYRFRISFFGGIILYNSLPFLFLKENPNYSQLYEKLTDETTILAILEEDHIVSQVYLNLTFRYNRWQL